MASLLHFGIVGSATTSARRSGTYAATWVELRRSAGKTSEIRDAQ